MKRVLAVLTVVIMVIAARPVGAGRLGTEIPSTCVAHVSFDDGVDFVDDYRCAGLAIEFHTAGVAFSPGPIWAGQWLFVDEEGQFRVGSCTFNRGIHPTIDAPSALVPQAFPNDPMGIRVAYLAWRYGDTTDNLTAAAMWAVLHYYAQDGAGTRRAWVATNPLVPSLDMIGRASGRDDIETLALALDAEAARYAGDRSIVVGVGIAGSIEVAVTASGRPVSDALVTLLMSGQDEPATVQTDADGMARATMPVVTGTMTVVAATPVPGPALVYRGKPAGPDPHGAQNLVTGGAPGVVSAMATVVVPPPTTTTTTTTSTTTLPPTTSSTSTTSTTTTTTIPPTTTSTTSTTTTVLITIPVIPTSSTTTPASVAVEVVPPTAPPDSPPSPPPAPPLPKTGRGADLISYLATALLVAGIGIVGVAGRRAPRTVI